MGNWLEWLEDEVRDIPGKLAGSVKGQIERAGADLWRNIRTDAGNAVNQVGAALTSSAAGAVAPAGNQPVTIPLSSGQLVLVAIGLAALIGYVAYAVVKR